MINRNKCSARYIAIHSQDLYTDLGYDYRKNIFTKTISNIIENNDNNKHILDNIQTMIVFLIDAVKQIKLQYMISLDKNDRNLN
jgi:hypothetical protein